MGLPARDLASHHRRTGKQHAQFGLDPAILDWLFYLLMVLGFFAGYVFISQEHEHTFLLLAIGLAVFANSFGNLPTAGAFLNAVLGTIGYFFGVVVVAIVVRKIIAWYME